jgi:hypothetical protein
MWIHNFVATNLANEGASIAGVAATADCILIKCGPTATCIGSDKIGHFFQQGFMLQELRSALGERFALAVNLSTEGLFDWQRQFPDLDPASRNELLSFLVYGRFDFYGFGTMKIWALNRKFGGFLGAPSSSADARANLAGMGFWGNVSPATRFDICDFNVPFWEEAKYSWRDRWLRPYKEP